MVRIKARTIKQHPNVEVGSLAYLWRLTGNLHSHPAWNARSVAEETGWRLRQVQCMNTNHIWGKRYEDDTPGVIW